MPSPQLSILPNAPVVAHASGARRGLRKSPTSWKLVSLSDEDTLSVTDSEDGDDDDDSAALVAEEPKQKPQPAPQQLRRRPSLQKPPRHHSMPVCVQLVVELWQRELARDDVSVMSDLFYDLQATDEQAFVLLERMHALGVHISLEQFLALPRCCIYSVLAVAL